MGLDGPTAGWSRIARTDRRLAVIDRKLKRLRHPLLWGSTGDDDVRLASTATREEGEMPAARTMHLLLAAQPDV